MKAIIPVAGVGSRLRPHTFTQPKVLLNVAGKPILGHILDNLVASGVTEVTPVVGQMGDLIEAYIRKNYSIPCEFVVQTEPKGLADAVSLGLKHDDKEVLVILGDTIFETDIKSVIRDCQTTSIGVRTVEDARRFGVVETTDNGRVSRLVEKPEVPKSNLVIVGIYLIRNAPLLRKCIDLLFERKLTTRGEYQLTDALQLMIEHGEAITTFPVSDWFDCGKPETLLATNRHLLDTLNTGKQERRDGALIVPPVYIHPDAVLERAIVGPYATIGAGAVVRDAMVQDSVLGEGARVESALVTGSLVGNNSCITGHFLRYNLGDSSEIASGPAAD
ncbi:NTP transferase domain-containing protein [bacterium]|nr:NTP transferase domain-containing protein [bacterium]MBU1984009.1 NTP transferase domain-containing protein [bacterium]